MTPAGVFVFVIVLAACAFAGYSIGKPKGYAGGGLALGLLLGIIGVIIIACVPKSREAKVREAQQSMRGPGSCGQGSARPTVLRAQATA